MNEKQWLAVHYLIINPYICIYERRCVIIANLLRCYRIWAWSCTSVHSLRPHPLAPCILAILTHLQGCIQNVYFDTPSFVLRIAHTKPMAAPFQERPSRHGHYIHYKNSNLKHLFVSVAKVGRDRRNGNTKNWVF